MLKKTDLSAKTSELIKLLRKNKYILIVLVAGLILLLIPWGSGGSVEGGDGGGRVDLPEFSLSRQESRLEETLSRIEGAGKVTVMLSLKSGIEQEIAWDEEISYKAGDMLSKSAAVRIQSGSGYQSPVILRYDYPVYQGALVIIQSSNASVRLQVTEAVAAITGLSADKITVVKGN